MKCRVYLTTTASLTITVNVPDDLDADDAREAAIEKAFEEMPRDICGQCTGWRTPWSRELGEWEIARDHEGNEVQPELEG